MGNVPVPIDATYALVFDDEFNGNAVDLTKWNNVNNNTFGTLHCTALAANNTVANGILNQTALQPTAGTYTGAALVCKQGFTEGYFEARIKMPGPKGDTAGIDASFWMNNGGTFPEIDVAEFFGSVGYVVNAAYSASGNPPNDIAPATLLDADGGKFGDLGAAFHVYAFLWEGTKYTWFIDGIETFTATDGQVFNINGGDYTLHVDTTIPLFMILWLLIGAGGAGAVNSSTKLPNTMIVDYVHVYQKGATAITPDAGYGGPGDNGQTSPPPPPPPPPTMFALGSAVYTLVGNTHVLERAGRGSTLCLQPITTNGTIISGPQIHGGIKYWYVAFVSGCSGWVSQSALGLN